MNQFDARYGRMLARPGAPVRRVAARRLAATAEHRAPDLGMGFSSGWEGLSGSSAAPYPVSSSFSPYPSSTDFQGTAELDPGIFEDIADQVLGELGMAGISDDVDVDVDVDDEDEIAYGRFQRDRARADRVRRERMGGMNRMATPSSPDRSKMLPSLARPDKRSMPVRYGAQVEVVETAPGHTLGDSFVFGAGAALGFFAVVGGISLIAGALSTGR